MYPKHTAITMTDAVSGLNTRVGRIIDMQLRYDIPIITIFLIGGGVKHNEDYTGIMDEVAQFFENLRGDVSLYQNKIKVSILGKWYDLPGRVVEAVKRVIDETKDYDTYFLNICLNYDGQKEIIDACKLIVKKVLAKRLREDDINLEDIKENIYSSYFLPPELIIINGDDKKLKGFLLWDSANSHIYFSKKSSAEFSERDFLKAVKEWQKS